MQNGRAAYWVPIVVGLFTLVVGLVIGYYANQANTQQEFVSVGRYNIDQARIEAQLYNINNKLDRLIERYPLYKYETPQ